MKMDDLKEKLRAVECPFTWKLDEIPDRQNATDIIEKLEEKDEEVSEPFVHLCLNFTIAYLYFENRQYIKAKQKLQECDHLMNSSNNHLIKTYKEAFKSICYASRAVLASKSSTDAEVKESMNCIIPFSRLSDENKSAMFAIKANVFLEFGVHGTQAAVPFAKEALKINSQEGDWHFLMGKLLSRLRHFNRDHMPCSAEMSHLQTAQNLTRSPRAAIFLANAYLEKSRSMSIEARKNHRNIRNELSGMTAEAKRLIFLALEQNDGQCVHIMIRCAYGLSHLPYYEQEVEKSKELLQEALKRSPSNPMANKLAGDLCLKEDKPSYENALKYYEVAASRNVFSAELNIFEINQKLGKNPDAEKFYTRLLNKFKEKNYQLQTLIHATEFYLFIQRDLFKALFYFLEVIKVDPEYKYLKARYVKYIKQDVNLYEVMSNESRIAIEKNIYKDLHQQSLLKDAISKIKEQNPKLLEKSIQNCLVQKMIDDAAVEEKSKTSGGRGGMRGRGGRGRGRSARGGGFNYNVQRENPVRQRGGLRNTRGNTNSRGNRRNSTSQDRRGGSRSAGVGSNRPRSRSASGDRAQLNSSMENSLSEQLAQLQLKMNPFQSERRAKNSESLSNVRSERCDTEEGIHNPLFIKYLEEKHRSKNHNQTFQEWLEKCSNSYHSPVYSTAGKSFYAEKKVSQEMMEEIRQKLLKVKSVDENRKKYQTNNSGNTFSSQKNNRYSPAYERQRRCDRSSSSDRSESSSLYRRSKSWRESDNSYGRQRYEDDGDTRRSRRYLREVRVSPNKEVRSSRSSSPHKFRGKYREQSRRHHSRDRSPSRDKYLDNSRRGGSKDSRHSRDSKYSSQNRYEDRYNRQKSSRHSSRSRPSSRERYSNASRRQSSPRRKSSRDGKVKVSRHNSQDGNRRGSRDRRDKSQNRRRHEEERSRKQSGRYSYRDRSTSKERHANTSSQKSSRSGDIRISRHRSQEGSKKTKERSSARRDSSQDSLYEEERRKKWSSRQCSSNRSTSRERYTNASSRRSSPYRKSSRDEKVKISRHNSQDGSRRGSSRERKDRPQDRKGYEEERCLKQASKYSSGYRPTSKERHTNTSSRKSSRSRDIRKSRHRSQEGSKKTKERSSARRDSSQDSLYEEERRKKWSSRQCSSNRSTSRERYTNASSRRSSPYRKSSRDEKVKISRHNSQDGSRRGSSRERKDRPQDRKGYEEERCLKQASKYSSGYRPTSKERHTNTSSRKSSRSRDIRKSRHRSQEESKRPKERSRDQSDSSQDSSYEEERHKKWSSRQSTSDRSASSSPHRKPSRNEKIKISRPNSQDESRRGSSRGRRDRSRDRKGYGQANTSSRKSSRSGEIRRSRYHSQKESRMQSDQRDSSQNSAYEEKKRRERSSRPLSRDRSASREKYTNTSSRKSSISKYSSRDIDKRLSSQGRSGRSKEKSLKEGSSSSRDSEQGDESYRKKTSRHRSIDKSTSSERYAKASSRHSSVDRKSDLMTKYLEECSIQSGFRDVRVSKYDERNNLKQSVLDNPSSDEINVRSSNRCSSKTIDSSQNLEKESSRLSSLDKSHLKVDNEEIVSGANKRYDNVNIENDNNSMCIQNSSEKRYRKAEDIPASSKKLDKPLSRTGILSRNKSRSDSSRESSREKINSRGLGRKNHEKDSHRRSSRDRIHSGERNSPPDRRHDSGDRESSRKSSKSKPCRDR